MSLSPLQFSQLQVSCVIMGVLVRVSDDCAARSYRSYKYDVLFDRNLCITFFYLCGWGAGFVGLFLMDKISHV